MLELSALKESIKEILVRDSITEAIKDLKQWLPQSNKKYNDLLLIEARKNNADRDRLHDVVSDRELEQTYNRIRRDLLGFIDSLQISDFNTPNDQTPNKVQPTYVFRLKEKANSKLQSINFGNFTDPRDNRDYRTIEINGLTWMAENLKYSKVEDCSFYRNNSELGEKYGCLYTWDAAKEACPRGWRLPTDEEFKALAIAFGGYYDKNIGEEVDNPKEGYKQLQDKLLINQFSGYREKDGKCYDYNEVASFWIKSRAEPGRYSKYCNYDFAINSETLYRTQSPRHLGLSCRYVRENEHDDGIKY